MNQIGRFSKLIAYSAALGAALLVSSAQAAVGKATVRAVRGTADYSAGTGSWAPLKVGVVLRPGSKVRTAAQSQVDLFLDQNGPVVRITEETELGLDKLNFDNTGSENVIETQLDLKSGRILGAVSKMAAASRYEVKTPQGVAGIRGTEYDISANGTIRVVSGRLVLAYLKNGVPTTQVINAGEVFTPTDGIRPIDPRLLDELLIIFGELIVVITPGGQIVIQPIEPFVSPIAGTAGNESTPVVGRTD